MKRRRITAGTNISPSHNCPQRTHAPCRLVAVLIPASWPTVELKAAQSRPAERQGMVHGGLLHAWEAWQVGRPFMYRVATPQWWQQGKCWHQPSRIIVHYLALHCTLQGLNTATSAEGFESGTLETVHTNSINKVPADEPAILGGSAAIIHHWDVICLSAFSEAHLTGPEDLAANPLDPELS